VSAQLSDVPGLQVVTPRATVEAVDQDSNTARVARRLGVNTLLSGTLQRENERYRITYRLFDAAGNQIAANAIDGPALFALQDRVADGVVRALRLRPRARRTPTPSGLETAEQQDRYLQAIGYLLRYDKPSSIENAIRFLEALAVEAPSSALVQAALGRAYLYQFGNTRVPRWVDLAEEACSRAQRLDPDLPEVDVTLGSLRAETGRSAEAIAAFRRSLSAQPNSMQALLGLARAFAASGQVSEAETTYRRAIELQPSFWASYNELAAFYSERGDYARAAQMFRRVTELTPDNAMAFSNLGGALSLMGRFANALEAYRASLALAPTDVAYSNLGTTQFLLGDYQESARSFEKAVRLTPGHFQLWANLGDAYRWTKGLEPRASEAYSRAIALAREELRVNPQNPVTHSYLALCLAKTGLPNEARDHAEKALAIAPENPEFLYNAAIVAHLAGRHEDTLKWIRSAAERGYGRALIAREPEFSSLRNNPVFRELVKPVATSS
jgi:tetratricopeptide (TPR) repeat protein